jgi:excisionase family DNA binding protein
MVVTMSVKPDLIGTVEAAEILGVERSTLSRWVKEGEIEPAMRLPGKVGAYLFRRAYIRSRRAWAAERVAARRGAAAEVA